MNWKTYSHLRGKHSVLSPSRYHWLNYDDEKLVETYRNHKRKALGTRLHALAAELIELGKIQRETTESFNAFVNDAIGYGMSPEVLLYYSPRCYGTADAIGFRDFVLRIHDLKTGKTPGHMHQLLIYAGLFCLDYEIDPLDLKQVHLKIYQSEEVVELDPEPKRVWEISRRIITADKVLQEAEEIVVL